jgi:hypothetical protein
MNNPEIFNSETSYCGGRFDFEHAAREDVKMAYRTVKERAQDLIDAARRVVRGLPEIHFDFILNGEINAVAFKSNERYFIGFNTGTLFLLRCVIGRMLSDSQLFNHIGNAREEREDLGPLTDFVPDAEVIYQRTPLLTPNDAIRRHYATFLQDQAIMFLVGHELTHIIHGHVDYLRAKWGQKVTTELGGVKNRDQEARFERQCLELDADRRSIVSRIDSLRFTFDSPTLTPPWKQSLEHPVEMIFDWAISIFILFRLFGDIRFSRTELVDSAYPPLLLREGICYTAAAEVASEIWGFEVRPFAYEALRRARIQTELAFARVLSVGPTPLDPEFVREGPEHLQRLSNYKTVLDELLRPYAFV